MPEVKAFGEMGEEVRASRSTNWELQNSHGDVKYSIGHIVTNIEITMYGARWVLEILVGTLVYNFLITMLYT